MATLIYVPPPVIEKHTTQSIVYNQALRYNHICFDSSDRDKHLQNLDQAFLKLLYPPREVKKQIDRATRVRRGHLLQDRPRNANHRTVVITYDFQLESLQHFIKNRHLALEDYPSLSQTLGGKPVLAYRQPSNLKPTYHTTQSLIREPDLAKKNLEPTLTCTINSLFLCTSTSVVSAVLCQQCPLAIDIGHTGLFVCKRINGHKLSI